jgi:hypothetical protein
MLQEQCSSAQWGIAVSKIHRRPWAVGRAVAQAVSRRLSIARWVRRLLVEASVVASSPILVTLMKEALSFSETSVLKRATRRNIPEDSILHCYKDSFLFAINCSLISPLFNAIWPESLYAWLNNLRQRSAKLSICLIKHKAVNMYVQRIYNSQVQIILDCLDAMDQLYWNFLIRATPDVGPLQICSSQSCWCITN